MEHGFPSSHGFSSETTGRNSLRLWHKLMQAMMLAWEVSRLNYVLLVKAELHTKSCRTLQQLLHAGHAVARCLHPVELIISRSNQYASWKVCGKCSARVQYQSKRFSAKGKGKGRASALASPYYEGMQSVHETTPLTPPRRMTPSAASPGVASDSSEAIQQALQVFQMQGTQMNSAMTQVGQSLQELARGQAQMIMLLQSPGAESPAVELNSADNMEEDQWSSVTGELQNPNDQQTSDH